MSLFLLTLFHFYQQNDLEKIIKINAIFNFFFQ